MKRALAIATLGVCLSGQALACTEPRITIDPLWLINHGTAGGVTNLWLGAEVDLFLPAAPTECVAGLGLNGVQVPSLNVNDVMVTVANPGTPGLGPLVPEFALAPDPAATAALTAASPGNLWFGFSGLVLPFVPPPLGPGDIFKIWFDLFLDDADVPALLANFATVGAGTTPALPPFDPAHPLAFGAPKLIADAMEHVPEPSSLVLVVMALGLIGFAAYRRPTRARAARRR